MKSSEGGNFESHSEKEPPLEICRVLLLLNQMTDVETRSAENASVNFTILKLCVYLSDTTIRWKMYVYLLHKINYMFRPYFHWPSSG